LRGLSAELVLNEVAELAERGASRHLDPLVGEERGELLPARRGDAARAAPEAPPEPEGSLRGHDRSTHDRECE
jgi:hypothetical protein